MDIEVNGLLKGGDLPIIIPHHTAFPTSSPSDSLQGNRPMGEPRRDSIKIGSVGGREYILGSIVGKETEPTLDEVYEQMPRRPSRAEVAEQAKRRKSVSNRAITGASQLTLRQSIFPICLVTILFFLWGFAYGLLDVLNAHFQSTLGVTKAQGAGLSGAYFGAYFLGPLTYSGWLVRRFGYRWTFIVGLVVFGIGSLMFWPSGVERSFGGFVGSMFIVGSGLSTLETSANPFIATCGPPRYSEFRLNLSQSFQAIGTVVAPLLAARVFFNASNGTSLETVQWTYLAVGCFVFLLAVVFYFAPIPEITDSDMADGEELGRNFETGYQDKPLYKQYILFWGVAAQFCYVGAQVAIANFFINYVEVVSLSRSPPLAITPANAPSLPRSNPAPPSPQPRTSSRWHRPSSPSAASSPPSSCASSNPAKSSGSS